MYVVLGCNHWIGYHLTNKLLDEGKRVIGVDNGGPENNQELVLFFGRNSAFEHIQNAKDLYKQYKQEKLDAIFQVRDTDQWKALEKLNAKQWFQLGVKDQSISKARQIELPLLFGEWMLREKEGMYQGSEFIAFSSDKFQLEGVYIGDFIEALIQLSNSNKTPEHIYFKTKRNKGRSDKDEENTIFIKESATLEKSLKQTQQHYQQFSSLYL